MMFSNSARRMALQHGGKFTKKGCPPRQYMSASARAGRSSSGTNAVGSAAAAVAMTGVAILAWRDTSWQSTITKLDAMPTSGDVLMLGPTQEPKTGILFPSLCNGYNLVGCGVRVKYGFVKVYAVGTYMDPLAMSAVKKQGNSSIQKALLDPMYPRTIRIVMNRSLSIDKYTAAIVEALEPRMKGEDMDKLDEFKKLNPPVDLVEGAEMEMTIRGDVMLYKNSVGGVGQIRSDVFCRALLDVYYGDDAVSPGHKESVLEGIPKMK
mmetsp:Transcript_3363/g.4493  ORF Transcript_3363/g.4493 Transcript_3363/m.4493 type:complete len:265 (+) Transcript_3363:82-876(+)